MSNSVQVVTAATNFALALELAWLGGALFRSGGAVGSARWCWSLMLLSLGLATLCGGLDHAFFESDGVRGEVTALTLPTWFLMGLTTLFLVLTTARQFLTGRVRDVLSVMAVIQFVLFTVLLVRADSFLLVIANYLPAALLLLGFSLVNLRSGRGSWELVLGILILLAASAIQALGFDGLAPLDRNGLYHVVAMVGIPFLYLGGRRLAHDAVA